MRYQNLIIIIIIINIGMINAQYEEKSINQHKIDSLKIQKLEKRIEELETTIKQRKEKDEFQKLLEDANKLSTL